MENEILISVAKSELCIYLMKDVFSSIGYMFKQKKQIKIKFKLSDNQLNYAQH